MTKITKTRTPRRANDRPRSRRTTTFHRPVFSNEYYVQQICSQLEKLYPGTNTATSQPTPTSQPTQTATQSTNISQRSQRLAARNKKKDDSVHAIDDAGLRSLRQLHPKITEMDTTTRNMYFDAIFKELQHRAPATTPAGTSTLLNSSNAGPRTRWSYTPMISTPATTSGKHNTAPNSTNYTGSFTV